jgi:dCMP deaminase
VLADQRGRILATGYNGPSSGVSHCTERGCTQETSCQGKEPGCACSVIPGNCDAVHAEQNALIQCNNIEAIYYAAVTRAPCLPCTRLLLNSAVSTVIFNDESSHSEAKQYFLDARLNKGLSASWEQVTF